MELGKITCNREDLVFIIAGLVREGITHRAYAGRGGVWVIELTGGY